MASEITVYCDVCGCVGGAGDALRKVQQGLRRQGWVRRHRRWMGTEILDICPTCSSDRPGAVEIEISGPG